MTNKKKGNTSLSPILVRAIEEIDETIPDSDKDTSYGAILDKIGEINAEAYIKKIAEVLGVKPRYVLPLAETLILGKKIRPTCSKYGLSKNTYYDVILPKVRENPEGIVLLRQLQRPHEAHSLRIEHVFYRTLEDKIEKGDLKACELWARMTGKIQSAGPVQVNVGQQVNVDPAGTENQRKEIITHEILKLNPKK